MKISIPNARIKEPTVATMFQKSHPMFSGYVNTRRGIPSSPTKCIGKNVTFMPMNMSQKLSLPSRSLRNRPYIFGNQ